MANSEFILDGRVAPDSARSLLDSVRRSAEAGWTALLLGALAVVAIVFALLLRLPDTAVLSDTGALCAASARLGWAAAREGDDAPAHWQRARADLARDLAKVQAAARQGNLQLPELAAFSAHWAALPAEPADAELLALAADASAVATAVRRQIRAREQRLEWLLKGLTLLLALTLIVPIHGLWRQRRRLRASLRQISEHLGAGAWQDAVQSLREDRLGAPSAFDALASGVEGVLGESDRRWQALADLSADWYWETDEGFRVNWLSGSAPAVTQLGWTPADVMGRRRDQIAFLEPPSQGWDALHRRMAEREAFRDVEFRARARRDGPPIWVSISGRPRFDSRGDFVGYEGVGRNITERKSAHERLLASELRWSLMAGLASDWYWETDAVHRLRPLSPELYRRVPEFAQRVVGRTRWEAYPDALTPEQWAEHRADLDARRPFRSLHLAIESASGGELWLSISGIPRVDGQGTFLGYHGVGRDITVRKQSERLLLRHNEELQSRVAERTRELEQINVDLDAFARQLAHELRTPISQVQGLARLITTRAAERLNDAERELLALQVQAAAGMRDTVEALLLLARSTVQAMPMQGLDLSELAQQAIAELPALERRAPVQWLVQPGLRVHGAAAALRIVLANLLGNAAKFTRKVEQPLVRVTGSSDADGRLRISVQDNGAGFDPQLSDRLFQPFNRLHTGEDFHGTGIGLTIVQRIVERHGGSVAARGETGHGACFEFTLACEARS